MSESRQYPVREAARGFNIPRSVLVSGLINEALPTTMKFESCGNRQRARHYVTREDAEAFYAEYLAAEETRETRVEAAEKRKWAKPVDTYSYAARALLEDRQMLKELQESGVVAGDLA